MTEITPEKTHQLLEKLADYVMTEVSTKTEVNQKITQVDEKIDKLADYVMNEVPRKDEVPTKSEFGKLADYVMRELPTRQEVDGKIDKLAEYVMNEVPTKREMNERFGRVEKDIGEVKQNVNLILDGMDAQVKQVEILKTEQVAIKSGLARVERRVDIIESKK